MPKFVRIKTSSASSGSPTTAKSIENHPGSKCNISAFLYFCQEELPIIKASPDLKIKNVAKELKKRWNNVDPSAKNKFELMALMDKEHRDQNDGELASNQETIPRRLTGDGSSAGPVGSKGDWVGPSTSTTTAAPVIKWTINWKIENFPFLRHRSDAMFSEITRSTDLGLESDADGEWLLECYPLGPKVTGESCVSLWLCHRNGGPDEIPHRAVFSIVNKDGIQCYAGGSEKVELIGPTEWCGSDTFISHKELFRPENNFLVDNALYIQGKIELLGSVKTHGATCVMRNVRNDCSRISQKASGHRSSSTTLAPIIKLTIEWKIENFSFFSLKTEPLYSETTKSSEIGLDSDSDGEWALECRPLINIDNADHVSIALRHFNGGPEAVPTRSEFTIVGKEGQPLYEDKDDTIELFEANDCLGNEQFITHDDLFEDAHNYLINDAFHIQGTFEFLGTIQTVGKTTVNRPTQRTEMEQEFAKLWESKACTDFTIVSSDEREISVHRGVLVARSEVFAAMLRYDSEESRTGRCFVSDCDGPTLEALLEYMYCNSTMHAQPIAGKVLLAADKYSVKGLKDFCEEYLLESVDVKNAGQLLVIADQCSASKLKVGLVSFVSLNFTECARHNGISEIAGYSVTLLNEVAAQMGKSGVAHAVN